MARFLLLAAVIGFLLWWLFGRGSARRSRGRHAGEPVEFAACAHCGVHLPRHEAIVDAGGATYCSDAHRLAGPKKASQ
jgi:uncharacterized protein